MEPNTASGTLLLVILRILLGCSFFGLVVADGFGMVLNGQVIETDPGLSVLDSLEFFHYIFLRVACLFDDLPKSLELVEFDLPVFIHVDCVEKLLGRELAKLAAL